MMVESIPERALQKRADDKLGRDYFVRRLTGTLINAKSHQSTGVVIGITGPWGSGKSSILNMLHEDILERHEKALVIRFDPWLVSGREDLIQQFFREIIGTIGDKAKGNQHLKKIKDGLLQYGSSLAPFADVLYPGATKVVEGVNKLLNPEPGLHDQRKKLFSILGAIDLPIVVLIDELDRVNDKEIRTVAQLVRAVADFPNISYVLAYDTHKVACALGHGEEKHGREYLEKIVQFPFPLPICLPIELKRLLEAELEALGRDIEFPENWRDHERYKKLLTILVPGILKTPRDIKRFTGTVHVLAGMVWGEVDWVDLLGFCALQTKAPITVDRIGEKYSSVIHNMGNGDDYLSYFRDKDQSLDEKLEAFVPADERSYAIEKMLAFLFSFFRSDRDFSEVTDDSICRRRPFLTVMRKGLLPGGLPRSYYMKFLNMSLKDMLKELHEACEQEDILMFLDRMEEVYRSADLADGVHRKLWKAIGEFTKKPDQEWIDHYSEMRDVIYSMGYMFVAQFMGIETTNVQLAQTIFDDFVENKDVHFPALILKAHFPYYGLYGERTDGGKKVFLIEAVVKKASQELAMQYRDALLQGEWLSSLYEYKAMFLIQDVGLWDKECRQRMNAVMENPQGLDAVCMIFFGDKYTSNKSVLSRFFDFEIFEKRVKFRLAEAKKKKVHPSVVAALKRFYEP